MEKIEYPKWKYHPKEGARLVRDAAQEKKHCRGWFDSPAEFGVETVPGVEHDPAIESKKPKEE